MSETITGILEFGKKTDGRLRFLDHTLNASSKDPVVPGKLIQQFKLRPGLELECVLGKPMGGGKQSNQGKRRNNNQPKKDKPTTISPDALRITHINTVEGMSPPEFANTYGGKVFEDFTSIDPQPRMVLEYPGCAPACRLIDLFCPIGYGQRGMIVSPPKAGKTTLLHNIANAARHNHPDLHVTALLIDERPEEVTDFRRNVPCEVIASSNDHPVDRHVHLAMLAIERAKRMVERGQDVLILMDSLTRLGRAFNNAPHIVPSTGRTLSGGMDSGALSIPKQIFGAARQTEEGGSLAIIATCLIDTGSRGDQVIFEEFKGTGNMELILDRKVAEHRFFPAIDLAASGTRKEDKLLSEHELNTMAALRRRLLNMPPVQQVDQLLKALKRFESNADLVGNPQSPGNPQAAARV